MSDVAKSAGVHVATVSRALRGDPRITAQQRARIHRLAGELGYRVNPLVAALMRTRRARHRGTYQATLAYITKVPPERAAVFARDFGLLFTGARDRALEQGYRLEEFNLAHRTVSAHRLSHILESRGIHGVLVAPLYTIHDQVGLDWAKFSTVAVGYSLGASVNRVVHDQFAAFVHAARECRAAGWRRLGLVLQYRIHEKVGKRWMAASLLDQSEQRPADQVPPLLVDELNEADFNRWFARYRPEVIFAISVPTVLAFLKKLGRSVPADVCVVNLDRRPPDRGIAGINQDYASLGANAVDILIGMMHRNERGLRAKPVVVLNDGEWVPGRTFRPRPAPA